MYLYLTNCKTQYVNLIILIYYYDNDNYIKKCKPFSVLKRDITTILLTLSFYLK